MSVILPILVHFVYELIKYEPVVVTFHWEDQGISFPSNIKEILDQGSWEHGHNFVHLVEENIDIDVTWNPTLEKYGFKTLSIDWDGKSSFVGVKNIIQRWDNVEIDAMKEKLIGGLDNESRKRREVFLKSFIEWINSINFPNN